MKFNNLGSGKHVVNCTLQGNHYTKQSMDAIAEAFERAEPEVNSSQNEGQRYSSSYGENGIDVLKSPW